MWIYCSANDQNIEAWTHAETGTSIAMPEKVKNNVWQIIHTSTLGKVVLYETSDWNDRQLKFGLISDALKNEANFVAI